MHILDVALRILWVVSIYAASLFSCMTLVLMMDDRHFAKDSYVIFMFGFFTICAIFGITTAVFT